MLKTQKLVHDMMVALGLPLPNEKGPSLEGMKALNYDLLIALVREESGEFCEWMTELKARLMEPAHTEVIIEAWAEVLDACADTIVVIHNTVCAMGIDLEPFFDEVHRSNMAKVGGAKSPNGKALKPKGWTPPQIRQMLQDLLEKTSSGQMSPAYSKLSALVYAVGDRVYCTFEEELGHTGYVESTVTSADGQQWVNVKLDNQPEETGMLPSRLFARLQYQTPLAPQFDESTKKLLLACVEALEIAVEWNLPRVELTVDVPEGCGDDQWVSLTARAAQLRAKIQGM